jgi:1-acyl-sn-glycerol-3-phosphate acyltransferase
MLRRLYQFYLTKTGWTIQGHIDPDIKKFIAVVGPHTANVDFIIGIMARSVMNMSTTKYLGKSQLFRFPYGILFRKLGGYPVDRSKHNNIVDTVVEIFNQHEEFSIGLAPEGTRSKVEELKTGFYHIARRANIPIIMVALDFSSKAIVFREPFYPTNDVLADFQIIIGFFSRYKGKIPELGIDEAMFERMKPSLQKITN